MARPRLHDGKHGDNLLTRRRIELEADPVGFLIGIVKGNRFLVSPIPDAKRRTYVYPTLEERLKAARYLASKILPDLKSLEMDLGVGEISVKILRFTSKPDDKPRAKSKTQSAC